MCNLVDASEWNACPTAHDCGDLVLLPALAVCPAAGTGRLHKHLGGSVPQRLVGHRGIQPMSSAMFFV